MTCGLAENKIWHLLRHGRLTSSRVGEIFNRLESTNSDKFVCEIMGYNEVGVWRAVSLAMNWGRDNEPLKGKEVVRKAAEDYGTLLVTYT